MIKKTVNESYDVRTIHSMLAKIVKDCEAASDMVVKYQNVGLDIDSIVDELAEIEEQLFYLVSGIGGRRRTESTMRRRRYNEDVYDDVHRGDIGEIYKLLRNKYSRVRLDWSTEDSMFVFIKTGTGYTNDVYIAREKLENAIDMYLYKEGFSDFDCGVSIVDENTFEFGVEIQRRRR